MRTAVLTTIFLLSLTMVTFSQEALHFAGVEGTVPFFYDQGGVTKGIGYDLFIAATQKMGVKATVQVLPFERILEELKTGDLDGTIQIYYNKDRESFLTYSEVPMYTAVHAVFVKKGKEFAFNGVKDLFGKRVGRQSGFFVTPEFDQAAKDNKFVLDEATDLDLNIKKLMADRIDCFISNLVIGRFTLKQLNLQDKVVALPKPIASDKGTFLAISKKSGRIQDQQKFMKELNSLLKQLHQDGTFERISAKY